MVPPQRRRVVLVREILLAYVVLLAFLFVGNYLLQFLGLDQATVSVSGGIVLFLIAIRMIFPSGTTASKDSLAGEPFLVPLAVPLFAGPSVLATLLLLQRSAPGNTPILVVALTIPGQGALSFCLHPRSSIEYSASGVLSRWSD
jgi:small neutral amino acid transporter SnatA (MarC family)